MSREHPVILWVGDAVAATGFAQITHEILPRTKDQFEYHINAICYTGEPVGDDWIRSISHPARNGGDGFGVKRMTELREKYRPDLVVLLQDPWNVPLYLQHMDATPIVGSIAVDGKNCRGDDLTGLSHAIFWTQFGLEEARLGGYIGPASVIPLGVDRNHFYPEDKLAARQALGWSEPFQEGFVLLNVNRNQPRKRMDLTLSMFAEWIYTRQIRDAYLHLHIAPTADDAYDILHLVKYFDRDYPGLRGHVSIGEPPAGVGAPKADMRNTYNAADALISTTQGEGFGLTTIEGMACGRTAAVPAWSALGEWADGATIQVPCSEIAATIRANAIGAVPDRIAMLDALDMLYYKADVRKQLEAAALARACEPRFSWDDIAEQHRKLFWEVLHR